MAQISIYQKQKQKLTKKKLQKIPPNGLDMNMDMDWEL